MTATERRYLTLSLVGGEVYASSMRDFASTCELASRAPSSGGRVYELSDYGTVRLVAQMATVS